MRQPQTANFNIFNRPLLIFACFTFGKVGVQIFFSLAPLANPVLNPNLKIRGAAHGPSPANPCPPPWRRPWWWWWWWWWWEFNYSLQGAQRLMFFVEQWVSAVCGMTAHGMCGRFEIFESARHFRIGTSDSNSNRNSKIRRSLIWKTVRDNPIIMVLK